METIEIDCQPASSVHQNDVVDAKERQTWQWWSTHEWQ